MVQDHSHHGEHLGRVRPVVAVEAIENVRGYTNQIAANSLFVV